MVDTGNFRWDTENLLYEPGLDDIDVDLEGNIYFLQIEKNKGIKTYKYELIERKNEKK